MSTKVAVIIPTYNRKEQLGGVLDCLKRQQVSGAKLEVVVVVDGSSDGTLSMLAESHPNIHVVNGNGELWYTRSVNAGLKRAEDLKPDYFLTLNDDVFFDDNYLSHFLSLAAGQKGNFLIGSVSYTSSAPYRITFSGVEKVNPFTLKETNYYQKFSVVSPSTISGVKPSANLSGRGMFFPASLLTAIGYFDERFPQYGSDTDFSYRATKMKIPVLISFDARIFEFEKLTSKGAAYNKPSASEYYSSLFNVHSVNSIKKSLLYYRKHGKKILLPLYSLYLVAGTVFVYFFKYRQK